MRHSLQRPLPPMEVQPITPRVNRTQGETVKSVGKAVNPLRWLREALRRAHLSQTYLASAMGISEPLLSAQLSEHNTDKHLSLRRLAGAEDVTLWKEFCLLALEDLGFHVVVMDVEEYEAHQQLRAASLNYARTASAHLQQRANAL